MASVADPPGSPQAAMGADASPSRPAWLRPGILLGVGVLLAVSVINYSLYYSFVASSDHLETTTASSVNHKPNPSFQQAGRDAEIVDALLAALKENPDLLKTGNETSSNEQLVNGEEEVVDIQEEVTIAPTEAPVVETEAPIAPFQDDKELDVKPEDDIHVVFSMSCEQGKRVLLQSILQYSAEAVGQRGPITQILSGCSPEQQERIMREEPALYHDFRRHFTPSYSPHPVPGVEDWYTPYNKPFALRHFLQFAEPPVTQRVVALIDGDSVFFKKLAVNTGADMRKFFQPIGDGWNESTIVDDTVEDGTAVAQDWLNYLGSGWLNPDNEEKRRKVCEGDVECEQALLSVSEEYARKHYTGPGPPYILTRNDFVRMVDDYCNFLVRMRKFDDGWMTEMFAYTLSAARHDIKHKLFSNLGVTHPNMGGEGREDWTFLSASSNSADEETSTPMPMRNPCEDDSTVVLPERAPVTVHYCQKYGYLDGEANDTDHHPLGFYFYKYSIPEEIITCESELLKVPPATEWSELTSKNWTRLIEDLSEEEQAKKRLRKYHEVWFECSMTKIVNQALVRYKRRMCPQGYNTFRGISLYSTEEKGG